MVLQLAYSINVRKMTSMSNKIIVFCTVGSLEEGNRIGRTLVEEHLAACVSLLPPLRSIYRWEGVVEDAEEILLVIKSRKGKWEQLRDRVLQLHSYEVPELIALPIEAGHSAYLEWIDASTHGV